LADANERIGRQGRAFDGRRDSRSDAIEGAGSGGRGDAHFWSDAQWLPCRDGKWRPVEPGTFPLAYGVSARVGRLRGYGNAIVPAVAAEVLSAFLSLEES
jgi:DNA (cytosine-5)-methyltransferase 1